MQLRAIAIKKLVNNIKLQSYYQNNGHKDLSLKQYIEKILKTKNPVEQKHSDEYKPDRSYKKMQINKEEKFQRKLDLVPGVDPLIQHFIISRLCDNPKSYVFLPETLQNNIDLINEVLSKTSNNAQKKLLMEVIDRGHYKNINVPKQLLENDIEIVKLILSQHPEEVNKCFTLLEKNPNDLLMLLDTMPNLLAHINLETLKQSPKVLKKIAQGYPDKFKTFSNEIRENLDILFKAVSVNAKVLKYTLGDHTTNPDKMIKYIEVNPECIKYDEANLHNKDSFLKRAYLANKRSITYVRLSDKQKEYFSNQLSQEIKQEFFEKVKKDIKNQVIIPSVFKQYQNFINRFFQKMHLTIN